MKKMICLLLALLMVFSVCGFSASAVATQIEAGDSMSSATFISNLGVDYASSLSKAGEKDWFRFRTVSDESFYTFTTRNNTCNLLAFRLYDANMRKIVGQDNIGSNSSKVSNIKLEQSTDYYIQFYGLSDTTGIYEFSIQFKIDSVPDSMEKASFISLNQTIPNSLDGKGDEDWFRFTSVSFPAEYQITLRNNNCNLLAIRLYDSNMKKYAGIDNLESNKSKSTTAQLESNTVYFIQVYGLENTTGNYEFSVMNNGKALEAISVFDLPNKTEYQYGEALDLSGLVVRARYSDNTSQIVSNFSIKGYNARTAGTQTLTISYAEGGVTKTATFSVTVLPERKLQSISVTKKPTKTLYTLGEPFEKTGLAVQGMFSDGSTENLSDSQYMVVGYDSNKEGTQTLTVTAIINGVSASDTFTVTVRKKVDFQSILNKIIQILSLLRTPLRKLIDLVLRLFRAL